MNAKHSGTDIRLKRAYEPASDDDGLRILVDRLWPRGVSKANLKLDVWFKYLAPTNDLRQWFGHDPAKWPDFQKRYRSELKMNAEAVDELLERVKAVDRVTLIYGAKDEQRNDAVVLADYLKQLMKTSR